MGFRTAKTILKRTKLANSHFLISKYYKKKLIKTVWYWQGTDMQVSATELKSLEIKTHI